MGLGLLWVEMRLRVREGVGCCGLMMMLMRVEPSVVVKWLLLMMMLLLLGVVVEDLAGMVGIRAGFFFAR